MGLPSDRIERLIFRPTHHPRLTEPENKAIRKLAAELEPATRSSRERSYFEPWAIRGLTDGPNVILGGLREIPLLRKQSSDFLEVRLSSLAGAGDVVVLRDPRVPEFEAYRKEVLGMGAADYLFLPKEAGQQITPVAQRCMTETDIFRELAHRVSARHCDTVLAHITTGTIWALARRLAQNIGRPLNVAGPLPTLSAMVNNKIWFSDVACLLLGPEAVPQEEPVFNQAALTGKVRKWARSFNRLVIKVPDSAGSAGNLVIKCRDIRKLRARELHNHLRDEIVRLNGSAHFPLLVQIWQNDVLTSPSVQLWIPEQDKGPPLVEGVFEQVIAGKHGRFIGARRARLPRNLERRLAHQALQLGTLFQHLGYFGRCSFDAVISGRGFDDAQLFWIECNGRWGGVSVPMTFLNMCFRHAPIPEYVIYHLEVMALPKRSFGTGMELLADDLWRPGRRRGVVFLTPSGFDSGSSLHFLSIETTEDRAVAQADRVIARLTSNA